MVNKSRKGVRKRVTDTKVVLKGNHEEDDILFCSCKLEYSKHMEQFDNVVYSPARGGILAWLKSRVKKMPDVIHLQVIKKLGKIINYL